MMKIVSTPPTARFAKAAKDMTLGARQDWDADMGSLISQDQLDKITEHVTDAEAKGAKAVAGGRPRPDLGAYFYEPTVLTGVTEDMAVHAEETFGPLVSIYPVASLDEAVRRANDTEYGLNASVWGKDVSRAEAIGRRIEAGNININDGLACSYASKKSTSGGFKTSGVGSRHGDAGMLKYTDVQNVAVLKKQVLSNPEDTDWTKQVDKTVKGLRFMRKLGIR